MTREVFKHGLSGVPEYSVWRAMRNRCCNPKHKQYVAYGGRGIHVCSQWNDFSVFYKDMGPRPDGCSIDRIDNNKGYSKENCKWSTSVEQNRNTRRTKFEIVDGQIIKRSDLLDKLGISKRQLSYVKNKKAYEERGLVPRIRKGTFNWVEGSSRNKDHPLHSMYKSWGYLKTHASGICKEWEVFQTFIEDMGTKPNGKRLLRKDASRPFSKDNCYFG